MSCEPEKLSALLDGDLGARAAERVRAHLRGCQDCRGKLAELEALKVALAAEAARPPVPADRDGDGWALLAARLGRSQAAPARSFRLGWWLAPVGLVVALGLGGGALLRHRARTSALDDQLVAQAEGEFRRADTEYRSAIAKLRTVTERARIARGAAPDDARYADAARALAAAAEKCRQVAEARPADPDSEELLFAAYQKEISFYQDQLLRSAGAGR